MTEPTVTTTIMAMIIDIPSSQSILFVSFFINILNNEIPISTIEDIINIIIILSSRASFKKL